MNAINTRESALVSRLDSVRLGSADRALAKRHMRQAEVSVDRVFALAHWIRAVAARFYDRLFPSAGRQLEDYLSGAVDRVDLEQRIRALERRRTPFWDGV